MKWVVKLGYYRSKYDGLAFIVNDDTETLNHETRVLCNKNNKVGMINVAQAFFPKIFKALKKAKRLKWDGAVLVNTFFEYKNEKHFYEYFNKLINEYVELRSKIEWKK